MKTQGNLCHCRNGIEEVDGEWESNDAQMSPLTVKKSKAPYFGSFRLE